MLLPTFRLGLRPRAHADDRPGRLCRVLDRAKVPYTRANPEQALHGLPFMSAPTEVAVMVRQPFRAPLLSPLKIAVVEGVFTADPALHEFAPGDTSSLREDRLNALVLPLPLALDLAVHPRTRPLVTDWMVVLTSVAGVPFGQEDRDLLWHAFGVPVFEQLRGWDGAVIARECEVHDGLHVDEHSAIMETESGELIATQLTATEPPILRARTGLAAELSKELCECGAETPRVRNLALLPNRARYAAAS